MTPAEIQAMTEQAGFEWDSLGFRDRMCFAKLVELTAAKEREACCGPDVTNSAGICAADMPDVVVQKYCAAIRARGQKGGV